MENKKAWVKKTNQETMEQSERSSVLSRDSGYREKWMSMKDISIGCSNRS